MYDAHDLDAVIEESHRALDAFAKGDAAPSSRCSRNAKT